ncbi:MAG TPA: hypothetical protein PK059_02080 [Cyclobacteriaceae bacterium]|nr:hypothetical protein [Cyclobacteriaceae bacterium]
MGYNEEKKEAWMMERFQAWHTLAAQHGADKLPWTLEDFMDPKPKEIDRDKYNSIFKDLRNE